MRHAGRRTGAVLVTVLLLSTVTWLALAASLLALRLQYEVAVAARDHGRASSAALHLIETLRAWDWWSGAALPDDVQAGGSPTCSWSVSEHERDALTARYGVAVTLGRAHVTLDATAHRPAAQP